jgi:hypothetical protein
MEFETKYPDIIGIRTIGKMLILDHYNGVYIQSPYYDDDSIKTIKTLRKTLEESVISPEFDIDGFLGAFGQLLYARIIRESKEARTTEAGGGKEQHQIPILPTFKYSRPFLHEAIILGDTPSFIAYSAKSDKIMTFANIEEPSRILRPPNREEYPYSPYEFADEQELAEYVKRAISETKDSLFKKAKSIVKRYNDQDNPKLSLLAIDIFWSYFQDKFSTTHYLEIVGDNDTGKSSLGNTYEAVGYRAVNMKVLLRLMCSALWER